MPTNEEMRNWQRNILFNKVELWYNEICCTLFETKSYSYNKYAMASRDIKRLSDIIYDARAYGIITVKEKHNGLNLIQKMLSVISHLRSQEA